jgi:hypothetical protein
VTDNNGYRVNKNIPKNREADLSILALGDSFLEALQVENVFTIPEIIRQNLEKKHDITVQADNAGVTGWDPNHYYLEAKNALARKKYDLGIVFLFVANDIVRYEADSFPERNPLIRHNFYIPRSLNWDGIVGSFFYPLNDILETKSHLFILVKKSIRFQLAKIGLTARYFPSIFMKNEDDLLKQSTTAKICKKIKAEFNKYNTPVFFVLIPAIYQVNDKIFNKYVNAFDIDTASVDITRPNKFFKKEFKKRRLTLVDPLVFMRNTAENNLNMYNSVDSHLNEQGHYAVSEYILPIVESYLIR